MGKNAVTLIELLTVIVIIAILVAIAVPIYTNRIERTRGERAIANIELIVSAAKQYTIRNNNISPTLPLDGLTAINDILNLELTDTNFNYSVTLQGTEPNQYRRIQAERNGQFIRYNLDPTHGQPDEWDTTTSTWPWMPQN